MDVALKPIITSGLISEIEHTFYHEINEIVKAHEIPPEMVINIDQTYCPSILIIKFILEEKDILRVSVLGTAGYLQIKDTVGITIAGSFFPI